MQLSDVIFLYIFLPAFMAAYAAFPPRKRPWLICAANILFIAMSDYRGLIFFAVIFLYAYFSAIGIYNLRSKQKSENIRRLLLIINTTLNALVFCIFSCRLISMGLSLTSVYYLPGACVIPLHAVSYVADVYRGDAPAQTRISSLASYIAFFPSLSSGPVLKYKNFKSAYESPRISSSKAAAGIRIYVCGLAQRILLAGSLEKAASAVSEKNSLTLSAGSFSAVYILYSLWFLISLISLMNMGRGVALILGFPVRPFVRFRSSEKNFFRYISSFNIPIYSWSMDYVFGSYAGKSRAKKSAAFLLTVFFAALWCGFILNSGAFPLLGTAVSAALIFTVTALREKLIIRFSLPAIAENTMNFILAALVFSAGLTPVILSCLTNSGNSAGSDLKYLAGISVIPAILSAAAILLSALGRNIRLKFSWIWALVPITELMLIILCTAFMTA